MAYKSVRTKVVTVEGQPRVNLVPSQDDREGSEHPVEKVPNLTVQVALMRTENGYNGLEEDENEDGYSELGMERV